MLSKGVHSHAFRMHFICIPHAFHMHPICIPHPFHIHSICIQSTRFQKGKHPYAFYMHSTCIPYVSHMHSTSIPYPHAFHVHPICIPYAFHKYLVYTLSKGKNSICIQWKKNLHTFKREKFHMHSVKMKWRKDDRSVCIQC